MKSNLKVSRLAIDLAKNSFQLYGLSKKGEKVIDEKLSRSKFVDYVKTLNGVEVYMEACGGANYWGRKLREQGNTVKLISPQHVKPFVGSQKNDRKDAIAILTCGQRPEAKFVAIKDIWQQDIQILHRIKERQMRDRISLSNQIHGFLLEYGEVINKGCEKLENNVLSVLERVDTDLSDTTRELVFELLEEFKVLLGKEKQTVKKIKTLAKGSKICIELEKLSGVGPMISTAIYSNIGDPGFFKNGRQVSAWLGLVPKQYSTGGKTVLRGITKNGNCYLRKIIIQGARSKLIGAQIRKHNTEEDDKILGLIARLGFNKAAVAVANTNTRRMWAVMNMGVYKA